MRSCLAHTILIATAIALVGAESSRAGVEAASAHPETLWKSSVEAILERNCSRCHGGVRQRGKLDVRSLENLLKGGESGEAIMPGKPDESLIFQYVQKGADPHMPPEEGKQLEDGEIAALKTWIAALPLRESLIPDANFSDPSWGAEYARALHSQKPPGWSPTDTSAPSQIIDEFIRRGWEARNVQHAAKADDRTLVRRLYLDLAGRIPTIVESDEFCAADAATRTPALVDKLLDSPEYARRMREVFDVVLMDREPDESTEFRRGPTREERRKESGWVDYLETAFRENRPWDKIVRELIAARPEDEKEKGAVWFLYAKRSDHQAMAEAMGPLAFGMRIECAQCHNHPLSWEIEQKHYWGLVAAFSRSQAVDAKSGMGVSESAVGGFLKFANLDKESKPAVMAMISGSSINEKWPGVDEKENDSPDLYIVPPDPKAPRREGRRGGGFGRRGPTPTPERPSVPKFSRRAELALSLTEQNPYLAKAIVNRMWAMLIGRGLVHPVDLMDAKHEPSHPELLEWLAGDMRANGYDLKRLIRNIVLTETYQLDSRPPAGAEAPPPEAFARAIDKPLSAEQLYHSVMVATGAKVDADEKIAGHEEKEILKAFTAKFPELFAEQYNATVVQGLFLSNSKIIEDLLKPANGNTTEKLAALESNDARIEQAYLAVLGRKPDAEEKNHLGAWLEKRSPQEGSQHLMWALVASAEFLVNH